MDSRHSTIPCYHPPMPHIPRGTAGYFPAIRHEARTPAQRELVYTYPRGPALEYSSTVYYVHGGAYCPSYPAPPPARVRAELGVADRTTAAPAPRRALPVRAPCSRQHGMVARSAGMCAHARVCATAPLLVRVYVCG